MKRSVTVAVALLLTGCGDAQEQAEDVLAFRVTVSRPAGVQCAPENVPSLDETVAELQAAGLDVQQPREEDVPTGGECGDPTAAWYAFEARGDELAALEQLGWQVGDPGDVAAAVTVPEPPPLVVHSGSAAATAFPGDTCWVVEQESRCTEGRPPTRADLSTLSLAGDLRVEFGALSGVVEIGVVPIEGDAEIPDVIPLPATTTIVEIGAPAAVDLAAGEYVLLVRAEVAQGEALGALLLEAAG